MRSALGVVTLSLLMLGACDSESESTAARTATDALMNAWAAGDRAAALAVADESAVDYLFDRDRALAGEYEFVGCGDDDDEIHPHADRAYHDTEMRCVYAPDSTTALTFRLHRVADGWEVQSWSELAA